MDKIDEILTRGVENVYPSKQALEKALRSGKKIRLYQGFDPSMPNLHLGNMVGLLKLKQFQELGHEVIFLVGDFTGMIGDPTDKTAARKLLTRKQVRKNCQAWKMQAGKILNMKGKNPIKWFFNSDWSDQVTFKDLIDIASHLTVQQMLERDFFQARLKKEKPIYLHEFLYPVAQGYDSIAMDVNLEVGGNDQTFNMLVGRTLMKAIKGKEKFVLTTKLLVDNQGEKVGKTAGNALFLNASSVQMYGGVMSFPDEIVPLAFKLLTSLPLKELKELKGKLMKANPMDFKKRLAFEIVKLNHSEKESQKAQSEFEQVFQKRKQPRKLPSFKTSQSKLNIVDLLLQAKLVSSRSEGKRLVQQGAIDIDGKTINDQQSTVSVKNGIIIRAGKKKFIKIIKE
ncbi:tyrosine--tRNA ligase [Patescibacteria group bacterium]